MKRVIEGKRYDTATAQEIGACMSRETLDSAVERFNGDFWRAVEVLIAEGWRMNDFRHAGIEEIFSESFNNPVAENMDYLVTMVEKAVKDEDYLIVH